MGKPRPELGWYQGKDGKPHPRFAGPGDKVKGPDGVWSDKPGKGTRGKCPARAAAKATDRVGEVPPEWRRGDDPFERDTTRVQEVQLPPLHPGQQMVDDCTARFVVLACGRRWGKSRFGVKKAFEKLLQGKRVWWIAPSYPMAMVGWRELKRLALQLPFIDVREAERTLKYGDGFVQVRSADNPNSLRGEGLDYAILDEAAFMDEQAWNEAVRPALADRQGAAVFLSTPKGRNWFWRLFEMGASGSDPDWKSFRAPTVNNPYITPKEIDDARELLPEKTFRQEFLAEFIHDGAGVFRNVRACVDDSVRQTGPKQFHQYIIGADWGRTEDFTVLTVMDATEKALVYMDRFNQIDYRIQRGRLSALYDLFKPTVIIAEKNSIGEPIIEELLREGLPVLPFVTTSATKQVIIDGLTLAFERKQIKILEDEQLLKELEAFEATRLPSGAIRYECPAGVHDDTVMSLALSWNGANVPPVAAQAVPVRRPAMLRF